MMPSSPTAAKTNLHLHGGFGLVYRIINYRQMYSTNSPRIKKSLHEQRPRIWLDKMFERPSEDFLKNKIYPALDRSRRQIVLATPSMIESIDGREGEQAKNWSVREIEYFLIRDVKDGLSRPIDVVLGPEADQNVFHSSKKKPSSKKLKHCEKWKKTIPSPHQQIISEPDSVAKGLFFNYGSSSKTALIVI